MRFDAKDFQTGAALRGAVVESLLTRVDSGRELAEGDRVGPFRIDGELGRGGMGVVYRASRSDGEYSQQVALKWMAGWHAGPAVEEMFRRERQALADLSHPNIARLLDGGSEAGQPWFAMELVEGQAIDRHCVSARLPLARRVALLCEACDAVAHAHARGVLHRDIKPANVLVDAAGTVKLLDFGIARLVGQQDSGGLAAFTPGFASPEQQRGETPTVASDVFQLGRLLAEVLAAAADDALPPALPVDLACIIARACAEDPLARYPTVQALAEELQRFLQRRPVVARGRSPFYRSIRFLQRHPFGGAAALLVVLAGVGMALWFTSRLREERDIAQAQAAVARSTLAFVRDDLLAAANPAALPGHELTVREALDRAAPAVATRFAGQPVEQAAVRLTLAALYAALGRDADALAQTELSDTASLPPSSDELRQRTRLQQIDSLLTLDRLDQAEARMAQWRRAAGSEWTPAFGVREATLLTRRGDYAAAEARLREVQQAARLRFGPGSGLERLAGYKLAFVLQMLGRHDDAHAQLEAVLEVELRELGEAHPDTLTTAHALGVLDRHRGRFEPAAERLRDVLERRIDVLGAEHPETLHTRNELATVLQELRDFAGAEPLFREVLAVRERLYGEAHINTRNSMSNLGLLYSLWGRLDEAAQLYERTLAIELPLMGERHPDTLALMHNIAGLYRRQQRFDDALSMHRRAIAGAADELGAESWQVGMFRVGHAQTLRSAQRWEDAEHEMTAAVAVIEGALGPEHARSARARQMLDELRLARAQAVAQ